jgi:hypothetical protein
MPGPATAGGAAVNRKPSAGNSLNRHRCSMIGIPAASNELWTGRSPVSVESMFRESMPTRAVPCSTSHAAPDAVR